MVDLVWWEAALIASVGGFILLFCRLLLFNVVAAGMGGRGRPGQEGEGLPRTLLSTYLMMVKYPRF